MHAGRGRCTTRPLADAWLVVLGDDQKVIQDAAYDLVVVEILANYTIMEGRWLGYVLRAQSMDRASFLAKAFESDYGLEASSHETEDAARAYAALALDVKFVRSPTQQESSTTREPSASAVTNGSQYVAADGTIRSRGRATKRW